MKQSRSKLIIAGFSILFVLLITCWLFWSGERRPEMPAIEKPGFLRNLEQSNSISFAPSFSSTNIPTVRGATNSVGTQRIDQAVALDSLKRWIKRREGKDIKIVDSQEILDLQGNPTCVNVLVTTRLEGLNVETLKQQLDANVVREHELREELQKAYQQTNITVADQLVAEISEVRTTFVQTNELTTYKVSLSEDRPPILAVWSGLPSEAVREEAARNLAANTLGEDIGIQSLVYYTGATTLLCFTNRAGGSIYIDPFRVLEVPMSEIQSPRPSTGKPDDDHVSVSDIAALWTGFLQP